MFITFLWKMYRHWNSGLMGGVTHIEALTA